MHCTSSNQEVDETADEFFALCTRDPSALTRYPIKQFNSIPELPMMLFLVLQLATSGIK